MPFRTLYSNIDNEIESHAVSSLEIRISINGFPVGRATGLRKSGNTAIRPVTEIGSDRPAEFLDGIKQYQGSLQTVLLFYGSLIKRISSMAGGEIDEMSASATLSNLPEFDIEIARRGTPTYRDPGKYNPGGQAQELAGSGGVVEILRGCMIESFESAYTAENALITESMNFKFVDVSFGNLSGANVTGRNEPTDNTAPNTGVII
jgi:hypothetical protein